METEFGATFPNFGLQSNLKFYESIKTSSPKICTVFGGMLLECKIPVLGIISIGPDSVPPHTGPYSDRVCGPQVLHKNPS
jgi:hypothetical protein